MADSTIPQAAAMFCIRTSVVSTVMLLGVNVSSYVVLSLHVMETVTTFYNQ